ncbi:MAG: FAD-dependent oxidoreductase [Candidatus Hodarchaeales archaeon]
MAQDDPVVIKPKKKPKRRKVRVEPHFLPVEEREGNFQEVNLGYLNMEEVKIEAMRCILCGKPKCVEGCKAHFDIPTFMKHVQENEIEKATDTLYGIYCFTQSIDRVCPRFCEQACVVGRKNDPVQIMYIKRYIADNFGLPADYEERAPLTGKRIAIIGSGPAGLTAAFFLAKKGHAITVFEKSKILGGMLSLGIPEYRLPQEIMQKEIKDMEILGVEFQTDRSFGDDFNHQSLFESGYNAILIAHGAHKPKWMGMKGETEFVGSWHAVDFLRDVNLGKEFNMAGKKVAVIGGGDVAIDAVRTSKRFGADCAIWYRRAKEQMPAEPEEIVATEDEGIPINFLRNPVELFGEDGKVVGMKVIKMELGEPDSSGRRRPIPIEGSEYEVEIDIVIQAISQEPDIIVDKEKFELSRWNTFIVNEETMETTIPGVFAAGDNVTGPDTAINAINHGHIAVKAIHEYIMK